MRSYLFTCCVNQVWIFQVKDVKISVWNSKHRLFFPMAQHLSFILQKVSLPPLQKRAMSDISKISNAPIRPPPDSYLYFAISEHCKNGKSSVKLSNQPLYELYVWPNYGFSPSMSFSLKSLMSFRLFWANILKGFKFRIRISSDILYLMKSVNFSVLLTLQYQDFPDTL